MAKTTRATPLPPEFLTWQIELRRHTMVNAGGAPHVGVAPLLTVRRPGRNLSVSTHTIICGVLPREDLLEQKTQEFRSMYEQHSPEGAKAVYDRGIAYLVDYYTDPAQFDPASITTLVRGDAEVATALAAEPSCQLVFSVFNLVDRDPLSRLRCVSLDCEAEVLRRGPVYDNVWWHNTLFHGPLDDAVVVRFVHRASFDTVFGRHDQLG